MGIDRLILLITIFLAEQHYTLYVIEIENRKNSCPLYKGKALRTLITMKWPGPVCQHSPLDWAYAIVMREQDKN